MLKIISKIKNVLEWICAICGLGYLVGLLGFIIEHKGYFSRTCFCILFGCMCVMLIICGLVSILKWLGDYLEEKQKELKKIKNNIYFHPGTSFEQSVARAAESAKYWKMTKLIKALKQLDYNPARGPHR